MNNARKAEGWTMPTNADLAAQLLRSAAQFFETIGQQNDAITDQMKRNAETFLAIAELVEKDPMGQPPGPIEGEGNDHKLN
ncbi:MAG: hypothetical protein OQJ87_07655 [Rhodospirillales bacterium]|nr:hypothetical protein [Rhodospirillales bacterium]MCW9002581.1 hypothetical protein [Rhodospirillales bacterium]